MWLHAQERAIYILGANHHILLFCPALQMLVLCPLAWNETIGRIPLVKLRCAWRQNVPRVPSQRRAAPSFFLPRRSGDAYALSVNGCLMEVV